MVERQPWSTWWKKSTPTRSRGRRSTARQGANYCPISMRFSLSAA